MRAAPPLAAPPAAPPPLPVEMFDKPIGLGAVPAPSAAPAVSSNNCPKRLISSAPRGPVLAVAVPAGTSPGFVWLASLAERLGEQWKGKREDFSSESPTSSDYTYRSSNSSEDSGPTRENINTPKPPPTAHTIPPAARTIPPAAPPPPLPVEFAQMFNEPLDLSAAPAAPLALSSSSWLEQQQLAETLEEQLTEFEAVEVNTEV